MNPALERGPLSVAGRRLYRSGQRLDPLARSATMDGHSQVSWGARRAHPFWLSRQGSIGARTVMLAVLPAVEHPVPACIKDQLDSAWAGPPGRIMSSLHAASRIGELIECSDWIQ
jgi:hypothetical protein